MILEGVVTNVANFGAFVDIGVHQDGLVHISQITSKFIKDPREVVRTGDIVKVRVEEVDVQRKRISLTMRLEDDGQKAPTQKPAARTERQTPKPPSEPQQARGQFNNPKKPAKAAPPAANSAMGDALAAAFGKFRK